MASASIPSIHFSMVPPDGAFPTNEHETDHERRGQAAASIRRGNVKISKPILEPITWVEGVPDASSQQQLGSHTVSPAVEQEHEEREGKQMHGLAVSTNDDHTPEPSPHLHHLGSSQSMRESARSQLRSTPIDPRPDQRDSVMEVCRSSPMDEKKKRRSGTIRTVLRKVFGRKEKIQSKQSTPLPGPSPKHEHSRSEPVPSTPTKLAIIRSQEELHKQNPLRSQPTNDYSSQSVMTPPVLPFPMNINAPDPSASPSNYLSFETGPKVHRRRATLPSIILSPEDATALRKMWSNSDVHPTPPGTQILGQSLPSSKIGMAVTSGKPENPNRRSRSAGALWEMSTAQEQQMSPRRRSSEIRYWRTSRLELEQSENGRHLSTSSECRSDDSSIVASMHNSMTEVSDAFADTGSSFHGDNVTSLDLGSVAVEPNSLDKHVCGVEARLSQLELNMQQISLSMQEATQQKTLQPFILDKAPSQRKSHASLNSSRDKYGSGPKDTILSKRNRSPNQHVQSRSTSAGHPSKTSASTYLFSSGRYSPSGSTMFSPGPAQTMRPSTSQAIPQAYAAIMEDAAPSPLLYDQLAPLYNALRYERSIREALETQVQQLRRDVLELSKLVTQLRSTGGLPTPSPEVMLRDEVQQRNERDRFGGYDSDDEGRALADKWTTPREEIESRPWGQTALEEGEMF